MNERRPAGVWRMALAAALAMAAALAGAGARGATPLATLEHRVLGTQLRVTPEFLSVPKGIAGSIQVELARGDGETEAPDATLAASAHVEAVLRGPSFPARRLVGRPGEPLMLPALSLVGDYQIDGIRLVDSQTGVTRLDGTPSSVKVQVFDEVLISKVETRPLSMQEITDRGIVVDANNFRAVEFEVGFVLDGKTISVKFPVVAPDFRQSTEIIPEAEITRRLLEAQRINSELSQAVLESGELPPELQRPGLNIQIRGINFERVEDAPSNLRLSIPPIPALLVVPGNIGYLNQFFSVQVFTENGAPANSGLSVLNVRAKLSLPPGPDGIVSTNYTEPGDDPLRFARVGPDAEIQSELPVLGPPPTSLSRFYPGQGGSAEFLVEGLQEGFHALDLDLTAELDGLAAGIVKVRGKAAGAVLVRNPKFSLSFSHPKTVRSGEPYMAYATVMNTSNVDANQVSITLRSASLSGGVLETPETVNLGNIGPGQSATASFRVRAQRTGSVRFSNLTTGENSVQGRFNLTLAVDERGVELSPDAIGVPEYVGDLPEAIQVAANRVLGQALSAATAPLLPPGVKPVSRAVITRRVLELAEAGQRIRYGDSLATTLVDLLLDWQGGRSADEGFDQIVRETDAGREWREALMAEIESADGRNAAARLTALASALSGRGEAWWFAASSVSGLETVAVGSGGEASPLRSVLPGRASYGGALGSFLASRGTTSDRLRFRATESVAGGTVVVLGVGTDGTARQWTWNPGPIETGGCFTFDPARPEDGLLRDETCDGLADSSLTGSPVVVQEAPPQIIAVLQDTEVSLARPFYRCTGGPANNYGNVIAVLFSKPMSQETTDVPSAFQLDGGIEGAGVQVQPGGRVALVSLREGISAIRPRQLTVTGIRDARGNLVVSQPVPVQTDFRDGVSMVGRVLRADGSVAAGVPVTVTYYDPWKDPFDRCDPTIITRITQKITDTNGTFSVDFIHGGVGFTVAAVDTGGLSVEAIQAILASTVGDRFAAEKLAALAAATNALASLGVESLEDATHFIEGLDRAVWRDMVPLDSGRMGHEMTIGLRFRGRGIVAGRVIAPDGVTPVEGAAVNLFPDPDSRELVRGVFSDAEGRFQFRGVPLGLFNVQVKSPLGHFRTVTGSLTQVRETNVVDIVLTAPDPREIIRTTLSGRVVEPADQAPHANARVFLRHLDFGLIAQAEADAAGYWTAPDVPTGSYLVEAFSRDNRRGGSARGQAVSGETAHVVVTLNGTGVVSGRVEIAAGAPVANALVAGGEELVRTGPDGRFRLTGVPLGQANISAGLEGHLAPGGFPRLGSAGVQVVAGLENFVVVRLRPAGMITGRVVDANGAPVPNVKVAAPMPPEGFAWVEADGLGRFVLPNLAPGDYIVSAPAPPVTENVEDVLSEAMGRSEEEILAAVQRAASSINTTLVRRYGDTPLVPSGAFGYTRVSLRGDGDVVEANIQYLPTGTVTGMVVNDQDVPIGARVRLTGLGLDEFGAPATVKIGDRDSDPALGTFSIGGLSQGPWALQAANPFYPVVLVTNGLTTRDALSLSNVVLKFPPRRETNGRLIGQVFQPDGSPAGAGVRVKIDFSDDYEIRTLAEGRFDTQMTVPARTYRVEAIDDGSGLRGEARINVVAGLTNSVSVTLLGKGSIRVRARRADDSPAAGAMVRLDQSTYPGEEYSGTTDAAGELRFENLFAGRYAAFARLLTGAATLETRGAAEVTAGQETVITLTLGPTGTIRGMFRRLEDGSPIAFARINIGNVVYPSTDANGRFEVTGLKLGTYKISAREPVSGRLASGTAVLSYDGQIAEVSLVELPQGVLSGTVYQDGVSGVIAGAEVRMTPMDGLSPMRAVTTGPDGRFEFPGMTPGAFRLQASRSYGPGETYNRHLELEFPSNGSDRVVDITLPKRTVYGRVVVQVFEPDGTTPASLATVSGLSTDPQGRVIFDGLRMGTHTFVARSTRANETSSGARGTVTLSETSTNATLTLTLSPVGRVRGVVLKSDGAEPAAGAEARLTAANSDLGIYRDTSVFADDQGRYAIGNVPIGAFRVSAIQGALAASESSVVPPSGGEVVVNLRLGASGSVVGRLVRADGTNAVTNLTVTLSFRAPSGLDGMATAVTGPDGAFEFQQIPEGPVAFEAALPAVEGVALVESELVGNGTTLDLGVIALDEDWPEVVEVAPEPGASGVPTDAIVRLTFSERIATHSIRADGIYLRGPTNTVPADLAWEDVEDRGARIVTLKPRQPLRSEATYRVTVLAGTVEDGLGGILGKGPSDQVGRPLLALFSSSFTTRDADAPELVSAFPTNGAAQIDPRAALRFSFNEPIRETGFSVTLTGPDGPVAGEASVGFGGLALAFTPAQPLKPNATYTVTISGIRDLAGNPMAGEPREFTFATLDTIGPEVAALRIADGRRPVASTTIQFEALLVGEEPGASVRYTANGVPIGESSEAPYRVSYQTPPSGTVRISAIATDRFGNDGPIAELWIAVVPNEAPVVNLLKGAPGNVPVPTGSPFAFTVSATDDVGVTNLTVVVSGPTNVVRVFESGASTNLQFTVPAEALAGEVVEVMARATDTLGAVSATAVIQWPVVDGTPPFAEILSPTHGSTLSLSAPLEIVARVRDNSANLQARVVTSGGLARTNVFDLAIEPNVESTNTMVVPLDGAARTGTNLATTVTILDGGNNQQAFSMTYRLPDVEPPRLLAIDPPAGATRVGLWNVVREFQFSEPLAEESLSTNLFRTTNDSGFATPHTLSTSGNNVRLNFGSPLHPGVTYTNELVRGIADRSGNFLADADGNDLPDGLRAAFTTAAILSVSPTNDAPVLGGETVRVEVTYEPELGARYFRFALNDGAPIENFEPSGRTHSVANILIPPDTTNVVISITASDNSAFTRPYALAPVRLRFEGNQASNQPPVIQFTRVSPPSGPVTLGSTFTFWIAATDDFGVTNLTLTASGPATTNAVFASGARRDFALTVPADASPDVPVRLRVSAVDTHGAVSILDAEIPLLELTYPFGEGTFFYSRGPAQEATIWAVDPTGAAETQITTGIVPVISPDGRYLAFRRTRLADPDRGDLHVRDLATGEERLLVAESGQGILGHDWLADSSGLLFDYGSWIDRVDRNGSNRVRFLNIHGWDDAPAVNRIDGRVAYHNTFNSTVGGLYVVASNGVSPQRIPNTFDNDEFPTWSPDGEWLAFLRDGNLFKIRPDGHDRAQLTRLSSGNGFTRLPVWDAEGERILAAGTIGGTNALWAVDAATGEVTLWRREEGVNYGFMGSALAPNRLGEPPRFLGSQPAFGSTNVSLWTTNVLLAFSRAIASNATDAVSFSPGAAVLTNAGSRLALLPNLPLQPGTEYSVRVNPGATDLRGQPLPPTNGTFTTARILEVTPLANAGFRGGEHIDASVKFDSGLGARHFRFALGTADLVEVEAGTNATQVSARLLAPLNAGDLVLNISASDSIGFERPHVFAPIPLRFLGNSGANEPPRVDLARVAPGGEMVLPGSVVSVRATVFSAFGITNVAFTASGAATASRAYPYPGPHGFTFEVPAEATPGAVITVAAEAWDRLGVRGAAEPLQFTVGAAPALPGIGTIFYSRSPDSDATRGTVWSVGLDGANDTLVTSGVHPRLSPDNRRLLVGRDKANALQKNIYSVDLLNGLEALVFAHSDSIAFYDWTPDMLQVITDYQCGIETMNPDGTARRRVVSGNCYDDAPSVNPVDGRVVFQNDRPGYGLLVSSPDFAVTTLIPNTAPGDSWPQWSPDGTAIAFVRAGNVFRIRVDGSDLTQLTSLNAGEYGEGPPVWTPDGSRIVFAATVGGVNGIYSAPADSPGALSVIPTTEGDPIRFVGSIARAPKVAAPAPVLVSVAPAANATRQPLWPGEIQWVFSKPLNPASVTRERFQWLDAEGTAVPYTLVLSSNLVTLRAESALAPGMTYTNRLMPGVTDTEGNAVRISSNAIFPEEGAVFSFTTARVLSVTPTNGAPVIAGQTVNVTVTFESQLGAAWFQAGWEGGTRHAVSIPAGADRFTLALPLPASATSAVLRIAASDQATGGRIVELPPVTLALTALGSDVAIDAPPQITIARGQQTNVVLRATAAAPLLSFGPENGWVPPAFMALTPAAISNTVQSGSATLTLQIDAALATAGEFQVPLRAFSTKPSAAAAELRVVIVDEPTFTATRWKEPVSGNWHDAARWTAGVPTTGLPAIIDADGDYTVTVNQNATVGTVIVGASSGTPVLVIGPRTFHVESGAIIRTNAVLRMGASSVVSGPGHVVIEGLLEWTGGGFAAGGPVRVAPGGVVQSTGGADRSLYRPFLNHGRTLWSGGRTFMQSGVLGGLTLNQPGGEFTLGGAHTIVNGAFWNAGTLRKIDDGTVGFGSTLTNLGLVEVSAGTLTLRANTVNEARFVALTNATLVLDGATQRMSADAVVEGDGNVTIPWGTTLEHSGEWAVDGETLIAGTAHFNGSGETRIRHLRLTGTLGGSGNVRITESFVWTGGSLEGGAGQITIAPGVVATIETTGDKGWRRRLRNEGRIEWLGGRIFAQSGDNLGMLENEGVFVLVGDNAWSNGTVLNRGEILKGGEPRDPATSYTSFSGGFVNEGRVQIDAGGIRWSGAATHRGELKIAAGAGAQVAAAARFVPGSRVEGAGDVQFTGGASEFAGDWGVTGQLVVQATLRFQNPAGVAIKSLRVTGGTLGGSGRIDVLDAFEWSSGTLEAGGPLRLLPGCQATFAPSDRTLHRAVENLGRIRWLGGGIYGSGSLVNRRGATFVIESNASWNDGVLVNEGEVWKTGPVGTTTLLCEFQNRGEVHLDAGTLAVRGASRHSGNFAIAPAATLLFGSSSQHIAGSGAVISGAGRLVTESGQFRADAGSVVDAAATFGGTARFNAGSHLEARERGVSVEGTLHLDTGAAVEISDLALNGNLNGADEVTITRSLVWTSGQMTGAGVTTVLPDAQLLLLGSDRALYRTLINQGRGLWTAGAFYNNANGLFRNAAGADFEIQGNLLFNSGTLENHGIIRRTDGTQMLDIRGRVENSGFIHVATGAMGLSSGGSHAGSFQVDADARLRLGGTHAFSAGARMAGPGRFEQTGTATFAGRYDIGGVTRIEGAFTYEEGADVLLTGRAVEVTGTLRFNTGQPVTLGSLALDGTLGGADLVRVTSALNWSGGSMRDAGVTETAPETVITISGSDRNLYRRFLINGPALWTAGTFHNNNDGRLVIASALEMRGNMSFNNGALEVLSGGVFRRVEGENAASFSQILNAGRLELASGTMSVFGGMTNSGTLNIGSGATLQLDRSALSLHEGTAFEGSGTVRLYGSARLDLRTNINLGAIGLLFEGSSSVAGDFEVANTSGGWIATDHNLTFPGALRIGGELRVLGSSTVLTAQRSLTLLAGGVIENEGTIRTGRFDREDGSEYIGAPPVIIPAPSPAPQSAPVIREIGFAWSGLRALASRPDMEIITANLAWEAAPGLANWTLIEASDDLQHWGIVWDARIEETAPGLYRARVVGAAGNLLFFRIVTP